MTTTEMTYSVPGYIVEAASEDRASALALFLLENVGSTGKEWRGRMKKADQEALFGRYFGKGRIIVDGEFEQVFMTVTTGPSGHHRDCVESAKWAELSHA